MGLLSTRPQPDPEPNPGEPPLFIPERSGVATNALHMLQDRDIPADEVVRVAPEAILFLQAGRCKTAWMRWTGTDLIVVDESGWPAEPSAWARAQLDARATQT